MPVIRRGLGDFLKHKLRPKPKLPQVVMYDSVTVSQIPTTARAVAGYVNGYWPTFPTLVKSFPHAHKLSIAVSASADAEVLDVERGDATPDQAPAWVKRQLARGVKRPGVYCAVSDAPAVLKVLRKAGIRRKDIRLFTAHYTHAPHRCSPFCRFGMWTRADATQYTNRALARNLDASLCSPTFFS